MAKELFINQWFSEEMRLAGERLVKRLQEAGAQVASAFWLLNTETQLWELVIASPLVQTEGPRAYYKRIDDINNQADSNEEVIEIHDIRVSGADHPIINAIKNSVLGKAVLGNNRLGRNRIGNIYIEDMYLYTMNWNLLEEACSEN